MRFANSIISRIKKLVKSTRRAEVLDDIGPFGALFSLKRYKNPILVSSADGVGTKLDMAIRLKNLKSIGVDLVAMNVNDILAMGAEPLFFLDYVGLGLGQKQFLFTLIRGMTRGCKLAGCALVGGETAEMPDVYGGNRMGLAGFAVGVVEKEKIIDGSKIRSGDIILGFTSSGLHSNGFSLVNKILKPSRDLLRPTRIYVRSILPVMKRCILHGAAHITGGGLYDNLHRILPSRVDAIINKDSWLVPKIFFEIQKKSGISGREMFRTFNMGIGFVLIVPGKSLATIKKLLINKERVFEIGYIAKGRGNVIIE